MRPFKFRAAAALDMRRKEEDAAVLELARKEASFRQIEASLQSAERTREGALADQHKQSQQGIDIATLFWHRNWIVRLQATVVDLRAELHTAQQAVQIARQAWQLAKRRRLSLERLRDRAQARHRADEQREELKVIDELARVRFTTPDGGMETGQ
jgi:flagellar export protein FliJ